MKQYLSLALILIFTVANSFSQTKDNSPEAQAKAMVSKVHKAIFYKVTNGRMSTTPSLPTTKKSNLSKIKK
ncbi:MAG: hypothetical protein IPP77_06550 [Bacteroidetes bacterium]|nr:hypothetical protein [Bacteroidota bacterium]